MKKLIPVILCCAMLLAACGSSADSTSTAVSSESSSAAESTIGGADGPTDIVISESTDASAGEEANTANLDAAVAAIEAVNPIANPRALDDFSVENELMLTMDNLVAYKGDVTNDQADCGLVFVAQAKDGQVDAVKHPCDAVVIAESHMLKSCGGNHAVHIIHSQNIVVNPYHRGHCHR